VYGAVGLIGAILQTAAVNQGMVSASLSEFWRFCRLNFCFMDSLILANNIKYLVARIITGLAGGQLLTAMPPYFAEVATPRSSGLMAGAHGSFLNLGFALAAWIRYVYGIILKECGLFIVLGLILNGCSFAGFHDSETSFGWRFPNVVLILWALCLVGEHFSVSL
jgi:Sugar (and other) transporter